MTTMVRLLSPRNQDRIKGLNKVHMEDNIADPLTKPLAQPKYECHTRSMGLKHMGE